MSKLVGYGRNIRAVRKSLGVSMEWVALEAGISVTRMRQIEKGCGNVTTDTLVRITKALGVSPLVLGLMTLTEEEVRACIQKLPRAAYQEWKTEHIGKVIVVMRKEQGLTQKALARKSGVSVARLRDVEHGCANATVKLLNRIAGALGETPLTLSIVTVPEEEIQGMLWEARTVRGRAAA